MPEEPKPKRKVDLNRREMPKQEHHIRSHNFLEVALGYTSELAVAEAQRCLQCKKPFCVPDCPVQIKIPEFIQAIADGDFASGVRILKERNSLPSVCGRVCPQEEQCEQHCALTKRGGTIAVGRLERFLGDWDASQSEMALPEAAQPTGKKIAIIGG